MVNICNKKLFPGPIITITLSILVYLIICLVLTSCGNGTSDNFIARDLRVTPAEATIGERILFEFWIDISADRGVTTDVTLMIDDEAVQTKTVHAEADSTTRVYFQMTANETGRHTVSIQNIGIDNLSGVFEVTEP